MIQTGKSGHVLFLVFLYHTLPFLGDVVNATLCIMLIY